MAITEASMGSLDLQLVPIDVGDCALVRVTGEIDVLTAPGLREALNRPGADHVIADMRGVAFLDSTGLGILVGVLKRLRGRGGSLKIVLRRGRIRRLFEITKLTSAFPLYSSFQDAIADDPHWHAALTAAGIDDPADWSRKQGLVPD
jgi:anti-sigma B factor antagonist